MLLCYEAPGAKIELPSHQREYGASVVNSNATENKQLQAVSQCCTGKGDASRDDMKVREFG